MLQCYTIKLNSPNSFLNFKCTIESGQTGLSGAVIRFFKLKPGVGFRTPSRNSAAVIL